MLSRELESARTVVPVALVKQEMKTVCLSVSPVRQVAWKGE